MVSKIDRQAFLQSLIGEHLTFVTPKSGFYVKLF